MPTRPFTWPRKRGRTGSPPCRPPVSARLACLLLLAWCVPAAGAAPPCPLATYRGLTSSFAEYRPERFHAGVDLSTGGMNGLEVAAVADGVIYRVVHTRRGYGKALYLRHDDGFVSVYAHLSRFAPGLGLEEIIGSPGVGSYAGDISLMRSVRVKKGDLIAYSGETGAGLPHLHFELRDSSNRPVNPYQEGFLFPDSEPPVLESLVLEPAGDLSRVNGKRTPVEVSWGGEPVRLRGQVRLRLRAFDGGAGGCRLGLYDLEARLDGLPLISRRFDFFEFETSHLAGTVIDPVASHLSPTTYTYNLFKHAADRTETVSFSSPLVAGWLDTDALPPGAHELSVTARDAAGNGVRKIKTFLVRRPPQVVFEESPRLFRGEFRLPVSLSGDPEEIKAGGWRIETAWTTDGASWQRDGITAVPLAGGRFGLTGQAPAGATLVQVRARAVKGRDGSPWSRSPLFLSLESRAPEEDLLIPRRTGANEGLRLHLYLVTAATVTLETPEAASRNCPAGLQAMDFPTRTAPPPSVSLLVERPEGRVRLCAEVPPESGGRPLLRAVDRGGYLHVILRAPGPRLENPSLTLAGPGGATLAMDTTWLEADIYEGIQSFRPLAEGRWEVRHEEGDGAAFEVRRVAAGRTNHFTWDDLTVDFDRESLAENAYLRRSPSAAPPDPELPAASLPWRLDITSYPFDQPATVRLRAKPGFEDSRRLGVYRWDPFRERWQFVDAAGDARRGWVSAQVRHFSDYILLEDDAPPVIAGVKPADGRSGPPPREVSFTIGDRGMGLDEERIRVLLDDREVPAEYDPDRRTVRAPLSDSLPRGVHRLVIEAGDLAGNAAVPFRGEFTVR